MLKRLPFLSIILLQALLLISAAAQPIRVKRYGLEDGLSHSLVGKAVQDHQGYMWFSTQDGLSRFDGYSFKVFRPGPSPTRNLYGRQLSNLYVALDGRIWVYYSSGGLNVYDPTTELFDLYLHRSEDSSTLSNQFVTCIYEDKSKRLWVGTRDGLNLYHPDTHTFTRFYLRDTSQTENLTINTLFDEGNDIYWVGTNKGLIRFNYQTRQWKRFRRNWMDSNSLQSDEIKVIYKDKLGVIWIGCVGNGLHQLKYHPSTQTCTFVTFLKNPSDEGIRGQINTIIESRLGELWIGTNKGVSVLRPQNRTSLRFESYLFDPSQVGPYKDLTIPCILEDHNGTIWVVSSNAPIGLCRYNRRTNSFDTFKHDPINPTSLSGNTLNYLYEDKTGVLWITSVKAGINKIDLYDKPFETFQSIPFNTNSLDANDVYSLCEDSLGNLWFGTISGLNRYNRKTQQYTRFTHNPQNPNTIGGRIVGVIANAPKNKLWIGYYDAQLDLFDPSSGIIQHYSYHPMHEFPFMHWSMRALVIDEKDHMFLGGGSGGLGRLWPDRKKIISYMPSWPDYGNPNRAPHNPHGINDITIYSLCVSRDGYLYVGTAAGGLNRFDKKTERFRQYMHEVTNRQSLSNNEVQVIFEDSKNRLWVGTGCGLNLLTDREKGVFERFTDYPGIGNYCIYGILEDENENLWISTASGLIRFNYTTKAYKIYTEADGIPSKEFNSGAYLKLSTGELMFGGQHGACLFNPNRIKDNPFPPQVTLTELKLFNKTVLPGDTVNKRIVLKKSLSKTDRLVLTYKEYDVTFEFTSLHFAAPEKNRYRYRLEPYDKDWKYTDYTRRFATYTRLAPGKYTFSVMATNNDGLWSEQATQITLVVRPPWWATWWFRILLALSIAAGVIYLFRKRIENLQRRQTELEERVAVRTRELKYANNELELQKAEIEEIAARLHESDQRMLRFFTSISHELRTPLTLIIGPLEKLLAARNDLSWNTSAPLFNLMHRNARRLLELINQLMDFRKIDRQAFVVRVCKLDVSAFLAEITNLYQPLAEKKHIQYHIELPPVETMGWFDSDAIEKVLSNLLSNAFKFTPENGQIAVRAIYHSTSNEVVVEVADNGPGIAPDELTRVFERFYQTRQSRSDVQAGTGIGLSLAKEIIELHKGWITVQSELHHGSVFRFGFPISQQAYPPEMISEPLADKKLITTSILPDDPTTSAATLLSEPAQSELNTVLIVEDNNDLRNFMVDSLSPYFEVLQAENGSVGLKLATKQIPDVIISDVMMPVMNGLEMCQQVKQQLATSHIPVLMLTALRSEEHQVKGLEQGADDYISKPFSMQVLLLKISNILETRKRLQQLYLSQVIPSSTRTAEAETGTEETRFLDRLTAYILENINHEELDADSLASELCLSKTSLYRKLKALTGQSISIYIRTVRLNRAAELLRSSKKNIADVSFEVGFTDPAYFTRCFTEQFSLSPSKYAEQERK